ncbi:MAG: hypothetical protein QM214_03865 [Bacillota bacterium]|jgi:hypothetical protein|nr:hypothetical protein [Bacillota bacterium]HHU43887.1 hypothetical protein [Clostridiales bacterium]
MDNSLLMLLPFLMGKGDNSALMQTVMSAMNTSANKSESSIADMMSSMLNKDQNNQKIDAQMISLLANMMSKNKDKEKNDFTQGANLIPMLMALMNNNNNMNSKKPKEVKEVSAKDILGVKEFAGDDIVQKIALVINHRNQSEKS